MTQLRELHVMGDQNLGGRSRQEYLAGEVQRLTRQVEELLSACKVALPAIRQAMASGGILERDYDVLSAVEVALWIAIREVEGGAT